MQTVPETTETGDWRDGADWWLDPRLAYAAGLADGVPLGFEQGRAAEYAGWMAALALAFGGPGCTDVEAAILAHIRAAEALDRRRRWDRAQRGRAA